MSKHDELLLQMEAVACDLVANARQLQQLSSQICTQEELAPLQETQDNLVARLVEVDAAYHLQSSGADAGRSHPIMERIEHRLNEFQGLNQGFVENVRRHQNLIQFESDYLKQVDYSIDVVRERYRTKVPKKAEEHMKESR